MRRLLKEIQVDKLYHFTRIDNLKRFLDMV